MIFINVILFIDFFLFTLGIDGSRESKGVLEGISFLLEGCFSWLGFYDFIEYI